MPQDNGDVGAVRRQLMSGSSQVRGKALFHPSVGRVIDESFPGFQTSRGRRRRIFVFWLVLLFWLIRETSSRFTLLTEHFEGVRGSQRDSARRGRCGTR